MTKRDLLYLLAGLASGLILAAMVASCIAGSVRATAPSSAQVVSGFIPWPTPKDRQATQDFGMPEVASPSPSRPALVASSPAPRPRLARAPSSRAGVAGTASWGCCWAGVVTRLPQGTPIRVCGPRGCWSGRSVGYGPAASTGRIADLSRAVFAHICGDPAMGLCRVTVSR